MAPVKIWVDHVLSARTDSIRSLVRDSSVGTASTDTDRCRSVWIHPVLRFSNVLLTTWNGPVCAPRVAVVSADARNCPNAVSREGSRGPVWIPSRRRHRPSTPTVPDRVTAGYDRGSLCEPGRFEDVPETRSRACEDSAFYSDAVLVRGPGDAFGDPVC